MPKYLIEREIPNAGALSAVDLQAISQRSCAVLQELGPDIQWVQSFVTNDKITCLYIAPNSELIREHAKRGGFPADKVLEVEAIIDPTTAESNKVAVGVSASASSSAENTFVPMLRIAASGVVLPRPGQLSIPRGSTLKKRTWHFDLVDSPAMLQAKQYGFREQTSVRSPCVGFVRTLTQDIRCNINFENQVNPQAATQERLMHP